MKKGKIVLGAAAAIVTIASAFAFKANNYFRSKRVYGFTNARVVCALCNSLWTKASGTPHTAFTCHTGASASGITLYGVGAFNHTWYTVKNATTGACSHAFTKVTITQ